MEGKLAVARRYKPLCNEPSRDQRPPIPWPWASCNSREETLRAIQAAINGIVYDNPYARKTGHPRMFDGSVLLAPGEFLQKRQQEVWQMLAESETTEGIALALHVTTHTVDYHRGRLYKSLGIFDVPGLVRAAIRTGLITP